MWVSGLQTNGLVKLEGRKRNCSEMKAHIGWGYSINLACVLLLCALFAGHAVAQVGNANDGTPGQQQSGNLSGAQPACYLGGGMQGVGAYGGQLGNPDTYTGQMGNPDLYGGQMGNPDSYGSQMEGMSEYGGQYGQNGQLSPEAGYAAAQGLPNQYGNAPQGAGQAGISQPQTGMEYPQEQEDLGAMPGLGQAMQGAQFPASETQMELDNGQQTATPNQIIAILQQAPDTLANSKQLAGQRYGVDPTTIPDNGVYNCIRVDPAFRAQVTAQLTSQGYLANPGQQSLNAGNLQSSRYGAGAAGRNHPYTPSQPYGRTLQSPPGGELRRLTPVPYPGLPSLRDLYSQEISAPGKLRRFGSDAFLFGTGNANMLPMDLPVGPDYVLGPGDNLIVNMWGSQSARLFRQVDPQGDIALPGAGTVMLAGLTMSQAQTAIQNALNGQFRDEQVELSLGRVRTVRVYVVGDVQRPGAYDISSLSTPLNALYEAGGPTSQGSLRTLKVYRNNKQVEQIDLYDFLLHGVRGGDGFRLQSGDTVLIPPVGPQVAVSGMVRRPAIYELKGKDDLKDVLNLAGGVLVSANLKEIRVDRVIAHERHTMLRVQISDGAKGESKIPPFEVQDGDQIRVLPILPYNEQVVYLEGHVFQPGSYAWREGMTVNDLVHSYQDVMPEPATRAEIVRLVPPDLHPVTIPFNLQDVLIGNDPLTLEPFDTIRIFGRYQVDPPLVSIYGPVLRPGEYPMSQGMTVAGLVRMAGGFRRSAYHEIADLSSYKIQNGQKVLLNHSTVQIGKAMEGDKAADVPLKPGDVVGIRQLSGWNDIGSSITISGEVQYAGTYGIVDGERLSSVLKRAGGFRPDAYPAGAILERVEVRQFEEENRQEMIRQVEATVPNASIGINGTPGDEAAQIQAMKSQKEDVLAALKTHPSTGRMVIRISADINRWANTPEDIVVRAGDRLIIPKRPDFVLVTGQVYNATGIAYRPGKDAGWYLNQAGGATRSGDKKAIFILRADGSVVANRKTTVFDPGILSVRMQPGDSVIVPEKVIGGSMIWRNLIGTAQIASSVAITGAIAGIF
jgi:protein involved in polysaccharide export with SLBB domain